MQQFHDILPGSSIAWVHADAEAEHARITERLEKLIAAGLACLAPGPVAVASARSRSRTEVVVAPVTPSGPGPVQQLAGGDCAFLTPVPAMGVVPADAAALARAARSWCPIGACRTAVWWRSGTTTGRWSRSGRWSTTVSCSCPVAAWSSS